MHNRSNLIKAISVIMLTALLVGCAGQPSTQSDVVTEQTAEPDTLYFMTSFYPLYALCVNVVQDVPGVTLSNLTQPIVTCPRNYALSDWDSALIAGQSAVILAGQGFESFEDAVNSADVPTVTLLSGLNLYDNGVAVNEESSHVDGKDPWYFLSVTGAMEMCIAAASGLGQLDEKYASLYMNNMQTYMERLENLADDMSHAFDGIKKQPVAVIHEGLDYLARQLDLDIALEYPREPGTEQYGTDLDDLLEALADCGASIILLETQAPQNLTEALEDAGYTLVLLDTLMTHQADGDLYAYERIMLNNARLIANAMMQ